MAVVPYGRNFSPRCVASGRFGTDSGPQVAASSIRLAALSRAVSTARRPMNRDHGRAALSTMDASTTATGWVCGPFKSCAQLTVPYDRSVRFDRGSAIDHGECPRIIR